MKSSTIAILAILAGILIAIAYFLPKLISSIDKSGKEVENLNRKTDGVSSIVNGVADIFNVFKGKSTIFAPSNPGMN